MKLHEWKEKLRGLQRKEGNLIHQNAFLIWLQPVLYSFFALFSGCFYRMFSFRTLLLKLMADQNIPLPTAPIVDDNDKPDNSGASKESAKRKDPSSALSTVAKKLKSGADAAGNASPVNPTCGV